MDIERISETGKIFRQAIIGIPKNEFTTSLGVKDFPDACCDDASQLLAAFLSDKGHAGSLRVNGCNGDIKGELKSHVWLLYSGIIIDITADQFENYNEASVIVSVETTFHKSFESEVKGLADFRIRFANDARMLSKFSRDYEKVLKSVNDQ